MRGDEGYVLIRAVAAGYDAQLAKPVEPMALLATVARLVQPVSL
jgi:CheY-like chemotaxis protein